MKIQFPSFLILCLFLFHNSSLAQIGTIASDTLEVNTLRVSVTSDGRILELEAKDDTVYKSLLYTEALWLGGLDGGVLHQSSQTYRQGDIHFNPGPISNDPNAFANHNKVYKVDLATVNDFINGLTTGVPSQIANWPAHGDTAMGEAYYLAPFVDVNMDGHYRPADGDFPRFKGDEAVYAIFNDNYMRSGGNPMGVEVHAMVYGFNTGDIRDSIVYKEYRVINRSPRGYGDTYMSLFVDFDLGNPFDDLLGTNISANSVFSYNADKDDNPPLGFGTSLASCGVRMISGPYADIGDGIDNDKDGCVDGVRDANGNCIPENASAGIREQILLSGSMVYYNTTSSMGNPSLALEYYNYQKSLWLNGFNLIIENPSGLLGLTNGDGFVSNNMGLTTSFAFPGNSIDTSGAYPPLVPADWFMSPLPSGDPKILANAGPFSLLSGEEFTTTTAFIWTRGDTANNGFDAINRRVSGLDTIYNNHPRTISTPAFALETDYRVFYSRAQEQWFVENNEPFTLELKVYNSGGQFVKHFRVQADSKTVVPLEALPSGLYLLSDERSGKAHKLIK